jgi:hypothetical protein
MQPPTLKRKERGNFSTFSSRAASDLCRQASLRFQSATAGRKGQFVFGGLVPMGAIIAKKFRAASAAVPRQKKRKPKNKEKEKS